MASCAQTLTPYIGWPKPGRPTSLQADTLIRSIIDLAGIDVRSIDLRVEDFRILDGVDREAFAELYSQWMEDSLIDSLPNDMKAHDSFCSIVALGDRAIPVIAAELRKQPSFLFLALEDITGEDPVPAEAQGDLIATVDAWLAWLRR